MKWNIIVLDWKKLSRCLFGAILVFSSADIMAESCSGKAGERLQPGTHTIEVCVPEDKCVPTYDEQAYCSKAQSSCTSKSDGCEFSSACYSLPDGDNTGVTSTVAAGAKCQVNVGKEKKPGVLCTFTTTVAAGGHIDCHCECGQKIPVPESIALGQQRELTGVMEENCSNEPSQKSQPSIEKAQVSFVNNSSELLQIFWLNTQGKRVLYRALPPHQSMILVTFTKRPLVVADKNGVCKRLVITDKTKGNVVTNK